MSASFCIGVRPPSELSPPDWASRNVKLANSERSSRFDIDQTPWWRAPMECAADVDTNEVVVIAPTGSGKSAMAEALIPWIVSEEPGPFLYASQTDTDAKFWAETRLFPALRSCDEIKKLWPSDRHKTRTCEIIFPHMPFIAGGANMSNFQEKSIRWGYGDEVWTWKPGLLREFKARSHDRWNRKFYLVSQGGYHEDDLHSEFLQTDMNEWSLECECGHVEPWGRNLLKWDKILDEKENLDPQASANTARLECPKCGHKTADKPSSRRALANKSRYVPTARGLDGMKGFRIHRLAIWWVPWSKYVLNLIEAQRQLKIGNVDLYRQLIQKDDCEFWKEDMAVKRKKYRISQVSRNDRDPKQPIPDEKIRFLTCDKGGDHFWGVVRAWDSTGNSQQLWEGYIAQRGKEDGQYIQEIQERYGVQDQCVLVDIGFEWAKTTEMCARYGWLGIRGNGQIRYYQHKTKAGTVEKLFSPIKFSTGEGGSRCRYIEIATDPVKDILWRLMNGESVQWEILPDASKGYHRHMKSEIRKTGTKGKGKQEVGYWETIDRQNHLWDCEVYNVAAALVAGVFDGSA